jgi:ATP-binding cassette subfamily B protein
MKAHTDRYLLTRFGNYLKPYKNSVLLAALIMPVSIAGNILFPWLIIRIIDKNLVVGDYQGLINMGGWLLVILMCNYMSDAIYMYSLQKAGQAAITDMRRDMFQRVLYFPRKYFDRTPMGVTLTRLTSDLEAIGESFTMGAFNIIKDSLVTLALLIFLCSINWRLTLVLLLVAPMIYFVTSFLRVRLRKVFNDARVILSQSTGFLQECLTGIKTVQLYTAEQEVEQDYQQYTRKFYESQSRSNIYDAVLFSIIEGITYITMGLMIWYGAGEILAGTVSIGILIGFLNTLDKVFVPIRDFSSQIAPIQRAMAAFEHIDEIYRQPLEEEEITGRIENPRVVKQLAEFRRLEFINVRFRYKEEGPWVLQGISFTLQKGEQIAFVGSTGAGKTTILKLLTRTYDNYEGSIRINGIELADIPKSVLGRIFSLMQQDVFLFEESLKMNISLGKDSVSDAAVIAAARFVYAHEFIKRLPGKYDFKVRDNGANLSSGQAQLISFARAVASNTEIIMLDEATSSVDSVTEHLIKKAIDRIFHEKTVIAIAHRLSTIQHSDQILVLEQGRIVEQGNHGQLLEHKGIYANLLDELQAADAEDEFIPGMDPVPGHSI